MLRNLNDEVKLRLASMLTASVVEHKNKSVSEKDSLTDAMIKKYAGVDFLAITSDKEARAAAEKLHVEVEDDADWGHCMAAVFEAKCEEHLIQPTFVMDHPKSMNPLCKTHRDDVSSLSFRLETEGADIDAAEINLDGLSVFLDGYRLDVFESELFGRLREKLVVRVCVDDCLLPIGIVEIRLFEADFACIRMVFFKKLRLVAGGSAGFEGGMDGAFEGCVG